MHTQHGTMAAWMVAVGLAATAARGTVSSNWSAESPVPHQIAGSHCNGGVANNMVVTSSGRLYVFYSEKTGTAVVVKFVSTDDRGATWSTPQPFKPYNPMPPGSTATPGVAIDSNDVIHVSWATAEPALYYARYHTDSGTWCDQQMVSNTPRYGTFGYSQVMADRAGRVHLFWHDGNYTSTSTPAEVWYALMPAGHTNFNAAVMLSDDDGRHSAFPNADVSGVTGDLVAVAWRNYISGAGPSANWDIQMCVSTNGGMTWGAVQTAAGGSLREWDPQLVVSRSGVLHLAYHQYDASLNAWVYIGHSADRGASWQNNGGAAGFLRISPDGEYHVLCKTAYDGAHDIVWYFWKREYRPGEDILGTWVLRRGRHIQTGYEYLSDVAPTNAAGYHNFAAGPNGVVHATYQLGTTNPNTLATIYHRSREMPPALAPNFVTITATGGYLHAVFDTEYAVQYQLQTSTTLSAWANMGPQATGTGDEMSSSVPWAEEPRQFIRLRAWR